MESTVSVAEQEKERDEHGQSMVTITVNGNKIEIHRGNETVVEIKTLGHVPLADELNEIVHDKPVFLADNASVVIKGGEVFVSNPRTGGSSKE